MPPDSHHQTSHGLCPNPCRPQRVALPLRVQRVEEEVDAVEAAVDGLAEHADARFRCGAIGRKAGEIVV